MCVRVQHKWVLCFSFLTLLPHIHCPLVHCLAKALFGASKCKWLGQLLTGVSSSVWNSHYPSFHLVTDVLPKPTVYFYYYSSDISLSDGSALSKRLETTLLRPFEKLQTLFLFQSELDLDVCVGVHKKRKEKGVIVALWSPWRRVIKFSLKEPNFLE